MNKTKKSNDLIDMITQNWKVFSKYIHGEAPKYFQTSTQSAQTKTISLVDFRKWKSSFLLAGYMLNKILLMFFSDELNSFPNINRDLLFRNMSKVDLRELGIKI